MMFAVPAEEYKVNDVLVRAMDRIFILHADHEQNASTSTVRLCGSSGANPYACIAAGIACAVGPGARRRERGRAARCWRRSATSPRCREFIQKVKDKNSGVRLMGFGHRVYKNYDPRAKLMRETCHEVLNELGLHNDRLFKLAHRAGKNRARGRLFRLAQALSQRRLLLGHRAARARHPGGDVHLHLLARAHGRLDRAVAGDDHRPRVQDRPAAPALQGRRAREVSR